MSQSLRVLLLSAVLAAASCATSPHHGAALSSDTVEALMLQGVVAEFQASHSGPQLVVLDSGEAFEAEFPHIDKIDKYLQLRRDSGKTAVYELE